MCNKRRRRVAKQCNEHRLPIQAPLHGKNTAKPTRERPTVLTRQERAAKIFRPDSGHRSIAAATKALATCADTAHTVHRIIGWRMETNHKQRDCRKRKVVAGASQVQYLVEWEPTLEEKWTIEAYETLGYTPVTVQQITKDDLAADPALYDQIACEVCNSKHDQAMVICDECDRGYHKGCLKHEHFPGGLEDTPEWWTCDYCHRTRTARHTRGRRPGDTTIQLYKVTWCPTWEPENHIPEELTLQWKHTMQQQRPAQRERPDVNCTDLERQGIFGQNAYVGHMMDTARHNVTINHQALDPYTDIAPCNKYAINLRQVARTTANRRGVRHQHSLTACCTGLDGKCVGCISPTRLQLLWDRYNQTVSHHTQTSQLCVRTFEEEVHHLLLRYRNGANVHMSGSKTKVVDTKNHWATPPAVMACLQKHLCVTTERFASPLNFNGDMHTYYSCHERDQVFGATWNAYSVKWTGFSQCNPEYEHHDMEKAVRWALNSALSTSEATLTVCVLPAWDGRSNTAYNRVVAEHPSHCHVLMRIPKRNFKFCTPDNWNGTDTYAGNPKWDVNVLLVGNEEGYRRVANVDESELCIDVAKALRQLTRQDAVTPTRREAERLTGYNKLCSKPNMRPAVTDSELAHDTGNIAQALLTSKAFRKAPTETGRAASDPGVAPHRWGHVATVFAAVQPLLIDPGSMVYTDGSVIKTVCQEAAVGTVGTKRMRLFTTDTPTSGAGVYVPRALMTDSLQAITDAYWSGTAVQNCGDARTDGVAISLDPGGDGPTNTITRAEGAAIWYTLKHGLGTTIATDSSTVLYQVRNMLHRPARMQQCKNRPLISQIVDYIRASPHHITLQKVKAHTGIPGNELADDAARHATRLVQYTTDMPSCDTDPHPPSHTQFWPVPMSAEDGSECEQAAPRLAYIGDLGKGLKAFLHDKHRVGYSNTDSVYYQAWARTVHIAHGRHSNMLMQHGKVNPQDRVTTQHYRYGGLNTAKFRHRMKVAPTPNCLLCGQPDGGHHSLSGCPHMNGMYIERHNSAGRMILKALLKGGRGADVVMHDIGHREEGDTPSRSYATRIPAWVYTKSRRAQPSAADKAKWDRYRPDILLVAGSGSMPIRRREVDIVEIKYCRDTDPSVQQARAELQHDAELDASKPDTSLVQSLKLAGYRPSKIRLHVILLGAGGTVYKSMHTTLKQLGLAHKATASLAIKLHIHATVYARRIMTTKWSQEHLLHRQPG